MDDSLTNIQWLGMMSGEGLVHKQRDDAAAIANRDIRIIASDKQIEKVKFRSIVWRKRQKDWNSLE